MHGEAGLQLLSQRFRRRELFNCVFIAALLVYAFHITLPTIIDRSISLFILSRIDPAKGQTIEEMEQAFSDGYVSGHDAVCRRIDEQLVSGNVREQNGRYVITPQGQALLGILRAIANAVGRDQYFITAPPGHVRRTYEVENGRCLPAR